MKIKNTNENASLIKTNFDDNYTDTIICNNENGLINYITLYNRNKDLTSNILLPSGNTENKIILDSKIMFSSSKIHLQDISIHNVDRNLRIEYQNTFYDEKRIYMDHTNYEEDNIIETKIKFEILKDKIVAKMNHDFSINGVQSNNQINYFSVYDTNLFSALEKLNSYYENLDISKYEDLNALLLELQKIILLQESLLIPITKKAVIIEDSNQHLESMKKYLKRR